MNTSPRAADLLRSADQAPSELSEALGISNDRIDKIKKGNSPTVDELLKISFYFDKSVHWLIQGEVQGSKDLDIPLIDEAAAAGFANDHSEKYLGRRDSYRIPGFSGKNHLLFKVHGDSMKPVLVEEDYLVAERVKSLEALEDSTIAVVVLKDKLVVKRMKQNGEGYLLHGENPDSQQYEIEASEIKSVWKVVGKVTREFLQKSKQSRTEVFEVYEDLDHLKKELSSCFRLFEELQDRIQRSGVK